MHEGFVGWDQQRKKYTSARKKHTRIGRRNVKMKI